MSSPASRAASSSASLGRSGSSTVKVAPRPGRPVARMPPPISSSICRQMARPSPTPPNCRVNEASACSNFRNSRSA